MKNAIRCGNWARWLTGGIISVSIVGAATLAGAIPTLTLSDGTTLVTVVDDGVGDSSPGAGVITYSGSVGVWNLVVTTGLTKPLLGSPSDPQVDIIVQASSSGAGTLYVAFSDNNFTGAGGLQEAISGHTVAGAPETVGALVAGNNNNLVGTITAAGSPVNFGSLIANIPVQNLPLLASGDGLLPDSPPYSLTEFVVISSLGRTATSVDASFANTSVPDGGATVTLLGSALAGLGILGCFWKRS